MKTKWLIRTGRIVLFLLPLFNLEIPDAAALTKLSSASGNSFTKEINQEVIRNNQSVGSDIISLESNIARIEYFFDTDPGYGNGIPVQFASGNEITIDDAIPVNSLEEGIHIFYLRVCHDEGRWSQTLNKIFLKTQLQQDNPYNITRVEYFFDTDPGYGKGTASEFSSGSNIVLDKIWSLNSLSEGIHMLYIRLMDKYGQWSETYHRLLLKAQLQSDNPYNIVRVEYFFDTDPGYGNGKTAEFTLNNNIIFDNNWPDNSLSDGIHILYVRALDEFGQWSQTFHRLFLKTQMPSDVVNIEEVEYFFDNDPGQGKGTKIEITPGEQIAIEQILSIEDLEYGLHSLNVRAKFSDNQWGMIYHKPFIKYPSYEVVRVEYFFDTDPGLGNGTGIPIRPSETVIIDEELLISTLAPGTHMLNVRAMSETNSWSGIYTAGFSIFATGIEDSPAGTEYIKVYPNPSRGLVTLELNNLTGAVNLQVAALNGSVLLEKVLYTGASSTLDLSSYPDGMYLLKFRYDDKELTQSVILAK